MLPEGEQKNKMAPHPAGPSKELERDPFRDGCFTTSSSWQQPFSERPSLLPSWLRSSSVESPLHQCEAIRRSQL